jgi:probable rRNA maturation factor
VKTIRKKASPKKSPKRAPKPAPKTSNDWGRLAERELKKIIAVATTIPAVRKLGPKPASMWTASVSLIGAPDMTQLNSMYRGKNRPTDVLSFSSPEVFQRQGHLGELVICLPVLKSQARELGHPPEMELRVLLTHGLLHLLGQDHELGPKQAAEQGRLEQKVLEKLLTGRSKKGALQGLIQRAE